MQENNIHEKKKKTHPMIPNPNSQGRQAPPPGHPQQEQQRDRPTRHPAVLIPSSWPAAGRCLRPGSPGHLGLLDGVLPADWGHGQPVVLVPPPVQRKDGAQETGAGASASLHGVPGSRLLGVSSGGVLRPQLSHELGYRPLPISVRLQPSASSLSQPES